MSKDEPIHRKDYIMHQGTVWDFRITRAHEARPLAGLVTASDAANSFWSTVDGAGRVCLTPRTRDGRVKASAGESVMADEWVSMTLEWKSDFRPDAVTSVTKLQGSPTQYLLTDQSGKTATLSGTDKGRAEPRIDGAFHGEACD